MKRREYERNRDSTRKINGKCIYIYIRSLEKREKATGRILRIEPKSSPACGFSFLAAMILTGVLAGFSFLCEVTRGNIIWPCDPPLK
jgi:hypothetical protein